MSSWAYCYWSEFASLKTKDWQFNNFVVTGGTVSCRNDTSRCQHWPQSCNIDDLLFSVFGQINLSQQRQGCTKPNRAYVKVVKFLSLLIFTGLWLTTISSYYSTNTLRYMRHLVSSHYNDVIMSAIASQITSLTIVYSIVYSGADKKKTSKLRVTGLCAGNSPATGEFPTQKASNAENVSIWWRHHVPVLGWFSSSVAPGQTYALLLTCAAMGLTGSFSVLRISDVIVRVDERSLKGYRYITRFHCMNCLWTNNQTW